MKQLFAALISVVMLVSISDAKADSIKETTHYACSIEGTLSNGKGAVIIANSFVVEKGVLVSHHDVITQFYFRARQKNTDYYQQMLNRGGFYANCKPFATSKEANTYLVQKAEKASKKKHVIRYMTGVNFDFDTYLLYKKTQKKYQK
jgi:hypothetical protein